jgi:hypothetical protein
MKYSVYEIGSFIRFKISQATPETSSPYTSFGNNLMTISIEESPNPEGPFAQSQTSNSFYALANYITSGANTGYRPCRFDTTCGLEPGSVSEADFRNCPVAISITPIPFMAFAKVGLNARTQVVAESVPAKFRFIKFNAIKMTGITQTLPSDLVTFGRVNEQTKVCSDATNPFGYVTCRGAGGGTINVSTSSVGTTIVAPFSEYGGDQLLPGQCVTYNTFYEADSIVCRGNVGDIVQTESRAYKSDQW